MGWDVRRRTGGESVRYAREHKQVTRRRIIEKAGSRFKRDGIDGSGISALMADAGLTNGAFYAHFASKDDLVAQVVAEELRTQAANYSTLRPGRQGLEDLVREYLSPEHRDHPGAGCPSAALLDEITRCGDAAKRAYTEGARDIVDEMAARLAPGDPGSARGRAIGLFTLLVGTLQLSRALADPAFADEVLERGIENALAVMD
ncbi:TetR/AcrR family transcriptional regulator [Streptomyces paludis]|uniref:TetR/AcrR family transcriptional regulator n=1 Tax=Streptomyces paludis TaxID=2282738 RepID=A0A345HYJ0_9ACTN|nr:TetR/AcrR family transcriptional regulator [Streptomyces paludis]AXG81764.1 TetR/AcrR family transcriptional regulator [Streptomyces paludis]